MSDNQSQCVKSQTNHMNTQTYLTTKNKENIMDNFKVNYKEV